MSAGGARLELVWPGKDKFLLNPKDENGKPVWVERTHPAAHEVRISDFVDAVGEVNEADPYADNLLFTGDSLDVLRILNDVPEYARHYRGKIKLIYIDPPFNTGQVFEHYDDWMEHSTWLSFMRDRLLLARDLLTDDGSIWVHLDDKEVHRMRCLMDEIFGPESFIATMVWQRRFSRQNDATVSFSHDYLLCYARSKRGVRWNRLPATQDMLDRYRNPDNDPRGPWQSVGFSASGVRTNGSYPITAPNGTTHVPPKGRHWATTEVEALRLLADDRFYFGADGNGVPRVKKFLHEAELGVTPWTWWPHEEVGNTQSALREIQALFPDVPKNFDTPKPEALLSRVIEIGSDPGDIVLDFFGGSGTTAAVAHKSGRRWVTTEIKPYNVETFTQPRLSKVVAGEDSGGISAAVAWNGGVGYRSVTVGPSMYESTAFGVLLADWATNGRFARAVAGQLGFEFQTKKHTPFCGVRGRMRLAVFDGTIGVEEVRQVVAALEDKERVTIVAKAVLPGAEEELAATSRGSRIRKAPRDLITMPRWARR
jgi:adenine-specific DNA-methyltransferase